MRTNQLEPGVSTRVGGWPMPNTVFGLGFAIKTAPAEGEPDSVTGECHWGGMAGTHFWLAPLPRLTGICMTQLMPGFWHPFSHDFKRFAYQLAARDLAPG
jgi:CubicO group peptidase (beta-lactamase class C family)